MNTKETISRTNELRNTKLLISSVLRAVTSAHTTMSFADMNGLDMSLEFVIPIELPTTVRALELARTDMNALDMSPKACGAFEPLSVGTINPATFVWTTRLITSQESVSIQCKTIGIVRLLEVPTSYLFPGHLGAADQVDRHGLGVGQEKIHVLEDC
jgi:hypothetical protein